MRVRCKANRGTALRKALFAIGYTQASEFPLIVGKEYPVLAMSIWRSSLALLLCNENNFPFWAPIDLLTVTDGRLPKSWRFSGQFSEQYEIDGIWGYEEIVDERSGHFTALAELEPQALRIFYREKDKANQVVPECLDSS